MGKSIFQHDACKRVGKKRSHRAADARGKRRAVRLLGGGQRKKTARGTSHAQGGKRRDGMERCRNALLENFGCEWIIDAGKHRKTKDFHGFFCIEPCAVRATGRPACSCLAGRMERSDWGGRETERGRYPMERFGSGRLRLRAKDKKAVNRKTNECYSYVGIACLSYCLKGDIIDKNRMLRGLSGVRGRELCAAARQAAGSGKREDPCEADHDKRYIPR